MENACFQGEVCVWAWQDWNETISGSCQPKTGGGTEGDSCDGANPCELDLVCAEGVYGGTVCHRDCKIYANALGCSAGHKCISLEDPNDPKKGYCVLKNPPPLPPEEDVSGPDPQDVSGTEDTGAVPDTAIGPDDDTQGQESIHDSTVQQADGGGPNPSLDPNEPTTVSGNQSGSDSGGCGATGTGSMSWILAVMILGILANRRRERSTLSES